MAKARALSRIQQLQDEFGLGAAPKAPGGASLPKQWQVSPLVKHTEQPGRLAEKWIEELNFREHGERGRYGPVVTRYAKRVLLVGVESERSRREILTMAKSADYLLKISSWRSLVLVGQALDVMVQRIRAIVWAHKIMNEASSAAVKRTAWPRAAELELLGAEEDDLSDGEMEYAARRYREKAKWTAGFKRSKSSSEEESDEDEVPAASGVAPTRKKKKRTRKGGKKKKD